LATSQTQEEPTPGTARAVLLVALHAPVFRTNSHQEARITSSCGSSSSSLIWGSPTANRPYRSLEFPLKRGAPTLTRGAHDDA